MGKASGLKNLQSLWTLYKKGREVTKTVVVEQEKSIRKFHPMLSSIIPNAIILHYGIYQVLVVRFF
ncbi:MAG: hypothetical protein WBA16_01645 [Nonlabens sp.]